MAENKLNIQRRFDEFATHYETKEQGFRAIADAVRVPYRAVLKWYYEARLPRPHQWRRLSETVRITFDELVADAERINGKTKRAA